MVDKKITLEIHIGTIKLFIAGKINIMHKTNVLFPFQFDTFIGAETANIYIDVFHRLQCLKNADQYRSNK